jgi:uncharacterized protein DUF5615
VLRLLADENVNGDIVRGMRTRQPGLDLAPVQDVGLRRADDPAILAWAAENGRVLVTHDVATMVGFAYDRVRAGLPMPGLVEVPRDLPVGWAIEELLLLAEASVERELDGQVRYLPL